MTRRLICLSSPIIAFFGHPVATSKRTAWLCCCILLISDVSLGQSQRDYRNGNRPATLTQGRSRASDEAYDRLVSIAAHDLDGDGNVDLVTVALDTNPVSIAAHDLNADGNLDLVTVNSPIGPGEFPTVSVLLGNPDGTLRNRMAEFPLHLDPFDIAEPQRIIVSDFNQDGLADVAVTENSGSIGRVTILLATDGGLFGPPLYVSVGSGAGGLAASDLNGDGHVDLVVANQESNSLSVLLGLGNGAFQRLVPDLDIPPCSESQSDCRGTNSLVVGDFDRDGNPDFAEAGGTRNASPYSSAWETGNSAQGTNSLSVTARWASSLWILTTTA